jgi:hypothetical protein
MLLLRLLTLTALFLAASGCKPNVARTSATGNALERIEVRVEDAHANVERAIPHTDPTGKVYLDSASGGLLNAIADTPTRKKADKKKDAVVTWYVRDDAMAWSELKAEHGHFFSIKQRHLFGLFWIIVGASYLAIALLPGAGIVGMVAGHLAAWLPYGNKVRALTGKS